MPIFFPHCRSTPTIAFLVRNWLIDSKETARPYEEFFVSPQSIFWVFLWAQRGVRTKIFQGQSGYEISNLHQSPQADPK